MDLGKKEVPFSIVTILSILFAISFISAGQVHCAIPQDSSGVYQTSQTLQYQINFTTDISCTNVLKSFIINAQTNSEGIDCFELEISDIGDADYFCEYKDGVLRKVHNVTDLMFNDAYGDNINLSQNLTVDNTGFFNKIGNALRRISYLWADDADITNITSERLTSSNVTTNNITSKDWSNVTIRENQIINLSHTTETDPIWTSNLTNGFNYNFNMLQNNITNAHTFNFTQWIGDSLSLSLNDDGSNLELLADVGGINYFELATAGAFFQLYANPGPANDYLMATITETQGADTQLNYYEGGAGHNRRWNSGSDRIGGPKGYLCSELTTDVDCDTSTTGADIVVQDDGWFGGKGFFGDGLNVANNSDFNNYNITNISYFQSTTFNNTGNASIGEFAFFDSLNNRLGIGTNAPAYALEIGEGQISLTDTSLGEGTFMFKGSGFANNYFRNSVAGILSEFVRGRGTLTNPSGVFTNSRIFDFDFYAQYDTTVGNAAKVASFGAGMTDNSSSDPNDWKAKISFFADQIDLGTNVNKITIPVDNVPIIFGEGNDRYDYWDGTDPIINGTTSSKLRLFNNSGSMSIEVNDVLYATPESKGANLNNMVNPSLLKRDGKTEEEFHNLFDQRIVQLIPEKDPTNCSQVYDHIEWCYNEMGKLHCELEEIKEIKEYLIEVKNVTREECGTRLVSRVSGGEWEMQNYEYIYNITQLVLNQQQEIEELKQEIDLLKSELCSVSRGAYSWC